MTYNFDPDRWYDNERQVIDERFRSGRIDAREYKGAIDDLDCRYDEMLDRLDGTYQLPSQTQNIPDNCTDRSTRQVDRCNILAKTGP